MAFINMARGKPDAAQIALSDGLLNCLSAEDCILPDGTDARNYGGLDGLPGLKNLFGEILDVKPETVIVGNNSSLNLMFDFIATFMVNGLWKKGDQFICPAPGYDRHFAICEYFGLEMVTVNMTPSGPDMDEVERLAALPGAAGMWNVPVFSNPTGYVYSNETIKRLAEMKTAHPYFRLMWDNAYAVHHFKGERPTPLNILDACEKNGRADRPVLFTSLSKVTFAGGSVSALAASEGNRREILKRLSVQTVGPDKINQLRHVKFLKNLNGVLGHMEKHAALMRPKFALADKILTEKLSGTGLAEWTSPNGGYFISVNTQDFCAKKTAERCKAAGVILTGAGATFPYMKDPLDKNLRIAPSYLSISELEAALNVLCRSIAEVSNV